ncbi:hypothetical protein ACFL5F_03955 [Planctomycetota bacterium]
MTTVRRLYIGSGILLVFMAGGFATSADWIVSNEAAWILSQIKSNRVSKEEPKLDKASEKTSPERIYCGQKVYPCYPATLDTKPDIPSPYRTLDAVEVVTAFTKDGKYTLLAVTVENGKP